MTHLDQSLLLAQIQTCYLFQAETANPRQVTIRHKRRVRETNRKTHSIIEEKRLRHPGILQRPTSLSNTRPHRLDDAPTTSFNIAADLIEVFVYRRMIADAQPVNRDSPQPTRIRQPKSVTGDPQINALPP